VESRVGEGTAFHVYFPASREKARQNEAEMETMPGGKERILFVDDEPSIVSLCDKLLRQLGYSVYSSTDPIEIKELFEADPHKYDLIVSDMAMPRMTGDRLAKELIGIRPDVPVIICTGFSDKMSPDKAAKLGIKELINKPIMKLDLAKVVRRVLDERKSRI
jgi:DNA-binding NtrC family response regulator